MSVINYRKKRTKARINYNLPVVVVHRSNKNMVVQVLESVTKKTILSVDTYKYKGTKTQKSMEAGRSVGGFLKNKKILNVVFDRNGFVYSGRVKAVVDGIKELNISI